MKDRNVHLAARLARAGMVALAIAGPVACKKSSIPIDIVDVVPDPHANEKVVVEVTTVPGATVSCESQKQDVVADAAGRAMVSTDLFLEKAGPARIRCGARSAAGSGSVQKDIEVKVSIRALPQDHFECGNGHKCAGDFEWKRSWSKLPAVFFTELEQGSRVRFGATTETAPADKSSFAFTVETPIEIGTDALAALSLGDVLDVKSKLRYEIPFEIAFPDGKTAKTVAVGKGDMYRAALLESLRVLEKKAVLYPGETAHPGAASLLVIGDIAKAKLFGSAKTIVDVDRVALVVEKPRYADCGVYQAKNGAGIVSHQEKLVMSYYDLRATVYDRRTGKKIEERVFPAETKSCPGGVVDDHVVATTTTYADADAAYAWAAGHAP